MTSPVNLTKLIITMVTGMSGSILCCSVFFLNIRHWRETSNPGTCDKISFVTLLTNLLYQVNMTVYYFFDYFGIFLMLDKIIILIMFMLQNTLFAMSFWNTAWLSIFYCVRLVNVSHQLFLRVKARFLSYVPHLMLGSLLCSIVINVPVVFTTNIEFLGNNTDKTNLRRYNITWNVAYVLSSTLIRFCLPFVVTCLCIGLSVRSILRHIWRMKQGDSHITSAQLQGHVRAVRSIIVHVMLDMAFYITIALINILPPLNINADEYLHFTILLCTLLYPTAKTLIIIYGNPSIKNRLCGCSVTP